MAHLCIETGPTIFFLAKIVNSNIPTTTDSKGNQNVRSSFETFKEMLVS